MIGYLLLILADILLAMSFSLKKVYQKTKGASVKSGFYFSMINAFFSVIVFTCINGFSIAVTPYSLIITILKTAVGNAYTIIGFYILKSGTMALYTMFLMTGGMIVPYLWGLIFLDETFSVLRTAALIVIIIAVILSNYEGKKANKKQLILCIAVFILNGFVSVFSKIHQIETNYEKVSTTEFGLLGSIVSLVSSCILYLIFNNKTNRSDNKAEATIKDKLLMYGMFLLLAIIGSVSSILQLNGAVNIPATVLYPVITGGTILFSTLAGMIFFKEKLNKRTYISVALCFIGTLLFL